MCNNKEHKELVSGCEQRELVPGHYTRPSLARTGQQTNTSGSSASLPIILNLH